jgi:DNA-binding cell septation regulator SpoVG
MARAGYRDWREEHAMEDITIFNLRAVNKGALKATVSVRLGSGLIIHDCKIIQQDGVLSAALPQRSERHKGGEVVYHDLVEFADPKTWTAIAPQLVAYYQVTSEEAQTSDAAAPIPPKRQRKTTPKKQTGRKRTAG